MTRFLIALSVVFALAGCSPDDAASSTTIGSTTTSEASTTSTAADTTSTTIDATTTTTIPQGDTVTVLLHPFSEMGPEWSELVIPYGEGPERLGAAPGGEGLMLGPEYGTQTPDGTWWFMDAAKQRFANFSGDGSYLGEVGIPESVLVDGLYFQYQNPIAFDDGRIIATGFRGEANTSILTFTGRSMSSTILAASTPWVTTDGKIAFGFSLADEQPQSLDATLEVADVDWFLTRSGSRYMVGVDGSNLTVDLPDIGITKTLQLRFSEDTAVEARAGIEVETGTDGSIFILFYGAPVSDESLGIGGLVTISPSGYVGESEPVTDPFTPSDPGSPAHLGVTPGTSDPWLMVVGEDGVHIHTR